LNSETRAERNLPE